MMSRAEHLAWAKERAFAEIDRTSGFAGWVAFKHDLHKHEELKNHIALDLGDEMIRLGANLANPESLRVFDLPGPMNMRKFIDGFN